MPSVFLYTFCVLSITSQAPEGILWFFSQIACSNMARSRSPIVFEDLNHVFHVRFILLNPWNKFHETVKMFSPSRWYTEPMVQPGQIKVKVTTGIWRIKPCFFCPLRNFQTAVPNFLNFGQMFTPSTQYEDLTFWPGQTKVKVTSGMNPCWNLARSDSPV